MTPNPLPDIRNRDRVRRFRESHKRIDYVPSSDVASIIEYHLAGGLDHTKAGVIDMLIRAGHDAMSGNAAPGSGGNE